MVGLLRPLTALFVSAGIALCGNGLETILLPFRADLEGFTGLEIGLIGSAYWLGVTIGCFACPGVVARVGHARAFTVFTAIATLSPLLEAIWQAPLFWWTMRGLAGVCFSGILMVLESWINSAAPNAQRGRVLGAYTITNFGGIVAGQQLLGLASPAGFQLFSISAMLFSLAAVPLSLTLTPTPSVPRRPMPRPLWLWKLSPAAVIGCIGGGLANGAFWALGPIYAKTSGLPASLVAAFMTCATLGGALAQWPVGKWSDLSDRRSVLATISLSASFLAVLLFFAAGQQGLGKLVLAFLFGASALPVYWVSIAHANDYVEASESVDVSSNLLLIFAVSAIAGPVLGSLTASIAGSGGVFLYTAIVHVLLAGFVVYRTKMRAPIPLPDRDPFVPMPEKSSQSVFELDPRAGSGNSEAKTPAPGLRLVHTRKSDES